MVSCLREAESESRARAPRGQVPPQASALVLQTHFSKVANSWSGSGLSWPWIICSRLRRMMSHRDWDALECCWGVETRKDAAQANHRPPALSDRHWDACYNEEAST